MLVEFYELNNNAFLSLELCLFFVVLMAHMLRL